VRRRTAPSVRVRDQVLPVFRLASIADSTRFLSPYRYLRNRKGFSLSGVVESFNSLDWNLEAPVETILRRARHRREWRQEGALMPLLFMASLNLTPMSGSAAHQI
jgi:hypothetical protein